MTKDPMQVFIYGGCVSRDTIEYTTPEMKIVRYVARQSWISAMNPPITVTDDQLELASAFQTRQVKSDVRSGLISELNTFGENADVLLIDILVERLGVLKAAEGYLTYSNELLGTKYAQNLESKEHIRFTSARHFDLWRLAAKKLAEFMETDQLLQKAVVLNLPLALRNEKGEEMPGLRDHSVFELNERFDMYYKLVEHLGFRTLKLPADLAVADSQHKWGEAPYHYLPKTYEWIAKQLQA